MAFDAYLKLKDVEGEATPEHHKGWIQLESFNWGARNSKSPGGGGMGAGKVEISDFNVTKQTFDEAEMEICKAGGDEKKPLPYLKLKFTELFVTDIRWSGASNGSDTPMETVDFSFGSVKVVYTSQKPDGSADKQFPAGWDLKKAQSIGA
ncbi:MAG: hypothetical protein DMD34_10150 [Gemmatimonadetes bacterium]|nr:MAG: hypothetical protein DMD34_10150 [Gemmatimonadota bacterium]